MRFLSPLALACAMSIGLGVMATPPVSAGNDCLKQCREQVLACKRVASKKARDCSATCRAKRADCPADATLENCPALREARQCATTCRHANQTEARACYDIAKQCRAGCRKS
jgi:hypothetical protein